MNRVLCAVMMLWACGGRTSEPSDGGADDSGEGDGDADSDGNSDSGSERVPCELPPEICPMQLRFCCWEDDVSPGWCVPEPIDFDPENFDAECYEQLAEDNVVDVDCIDGGYFHPETCPDGYPHCCTYQGRELCVDHLPVGPRCDE